MPYLVPWKSGVHRIAGLALYRALLSQCSSAPLADNQKLAISNIVKNRFQANKYVQSQRLLKLAFTAGYEALDLLDASVSGNQPSTQRLADILSLTPSHLTRSPKPKRRKYEKTHDPHAKLAICGNGSSIIARPRPSSYFDTIAPKPNALTAPMPLPDSTPQPASLSPSQPVAEGVDIVRSTENVSIIPPRPRRRIPRLCSANRIPFLRIKKPQPENLSRVLRNKIEQRQSRVNRLDRLLKEYQIGIQEDLWDKRVRLALAGQTQNGALEGDTGDLELHESGDVEEIVENTKAEDGTGARGSGTRNGQKKEKKGGNAWQTEIWNAVKEVEGQIRDAYRANARMARRMQDVVDKEVEMRERERREWRVMRRNAKRAEKIRNQDGDGQRQAEVP